MDIKKITISLFISVTVFSCGNQSGKTTDQNTQNFDPVRTFHQKCGVCHGRDGKMMASGSPDLTTSRFTKEEIISIVTYGKKTMPPQKDVLTPEQISAIADHVLTLRNQ